MNKIYDKLFLAIAVIILAGGVYLYVQASDAALDKGQLINTTPAKNPYQPEPVPSSEDKETEWPEPVAQPSGPNWLYDVFTPPKIYIRDGKLDAEPPKEVIPPPEFGVYLAVVEQNPYRIQIEGYIEEDLKDASKSLILLYNEETQRQVRARPGDEKADSEFKLLSFEIDRIRDQDNNIAKVATAVILDTRSGAEVKLVHGERLLDQAVTVIIRSEEDSTFEVVLKDAPTNFEGPIGHYTLKEINLEESAVTVEKHTQEEFEAETRVLTASVAKKIIPKDNIPVKTPDLDSFEALDSIF